MVERVILKQAPLCLYTVADSCSAINRYCTRGPHDNVPFSACTFVELSLNIANVLSHTLWQDYYEFCIHAGSYFKLRYKIC